ncbi:MAG: response regulator [Lachnospiraceae bacterium]|nr:response regulator [Lachnospiraceae bacterium]
MADWVVVVDDDIANLKLAGQLLSDAGIRVTAMRSGAMLLKYLEKNRPELILLDVMMPEMDGFETLKKLKESPAKDIPVIFLTAKENEESKEKGLEMGAIDFIRKPFIPDDLIKRVKEALAH